MTARSSRRDGDDPLDALAAARVPWTSARVAAWAGDEATLRARWRDSLAGEAERLDNAELGRAFRDHVGVVPVADPLAWANRRLALPGGGWCVAGPRFRALDVRRPFVDVVATSRPPRADDLATIAAAALAAFAPFSPLAVRVLVPDPDALVTQAASRFARVSVDQYVVAGRVAELRRRPRLAGFERVALRPGDAAEAAAATAAAYREGTARHPELPEWSSPSTEGELADCAEEGLLFAVDVDGAPAGVVAAFADSGFALTGFVVQEVVLAGAFRGQGLGPAVLQRLLDALPAGDADALWGTIHPENRPSLRNARSVGREIVAGYVWLTPSTE